MVENRVGAAGNVAAEATARAPADGYTLLSDGIAQAISMSLFKAVTFDIVADFEPIGFIGSTPAILVVNAELGVKSVAELIALAKSRPGQLTHGTSGVGTAPHMAAELFNLMAGVKLLHVPYRGGALALKDLIGGQLQVMFDTMPESIGLIRAGTLRPLAVTTAERAPVLPDVPTIGDFLPGYEASAWYGIGAPRNTPAEIVDQLNQEINAGLADARIKARLVELGGTVIAGSPADFKMFIADEAAKWAKVIRFAGIKAE
jgi:tripartite-type tricarboxylate transporter receptor subunit TctC